MTDLPEIAVVVGAFDRQRFLRGAVRSLEAQTLPRERFEIVVTKNFRDPDLDRSLEAAGARLLLDSEPVRGRFLHHAIDAVTAPWVTILDDDDEYEPERLARIVEVATKHPDVGFYRNRVLVIDGDGRRVPPERWRRDETDAGMDVLGPLHLPPDGKSGLFELATQRTFATFNNSTMAFRRDLLDGSLGEALDRVRNVEDRFLLLVGAIAPVGVFLDDRRLTRFRFYGGMVTASPQWIGRAATAEAVIAAIAREHGQDAFAAWFRDLAVRHGREQLGETIMERIASGAGRSEVARLASGYFRYLAGHRTERRLSLENWAPGLYGASYPLFPGATRRLAARRITRGPG